MSTAGPAGGGESKDSEGEWGTGGTSAGAERAEQESQAMAKAEADKKGAADGSGGSQEQESQDCCVCLSERKSVVLLPCRHMCVCQACGLDDETLLDRCPMCRTAIEHRFRVFT